MSIQSGIGAACAAIEIMALINNAQVKDEPASDILEKVLQKAKEIKEAGEDGWY